MKEKDVMSYDELHYFDIGTPELEKIELGTSLTQMDENSNPIEKEKQYTHEKSKRVTVTGFSNEFPLTSDLIKNQAVSEYFYNIFRDRKTGKDAEVTHYIVELWNPVPEQKETYKARKIVQTVSISGKTAAPGEQIAYSGSLKGGDFIDGTFSTETRKFTPTPAAAAAMAKIAPAKEVLNK